MSDHQSVKASFAIFTPEEGFDMDDAIAHVTKVAAEIEDTRNINVAILKGLHHSWVAVFGVQRVVEATNLPEAAAFTKGLRCPVRKVESGWFKLNSQQTRKDLPFAQISVGDIVSIRSINKKTSSDHTSWEEEDSLSYSCIAILRAYFHRFKGLYSCSFFDSLDKKRIIGIAVWDTIESARFVAEHPESNPALAYWEHAEELKFHIYQAVYATTRRDSSLPGFQISFESP
ncbi:hypothetical protein SUGI_0234020 [Cryptomeria japonica]|uniref:uncharacterized protein LOC131074356 n=1 Tax=Cryptomeria japonica TaxID=3369 RepID=UPI002408CA73|nr:uncharacterized protein LOC131074356 [Cryptomeria japonica]GLJ14472.1 hypothetical protein SUGI_0234020 [Cryptomeria japonica]